MLAKWMPSINTSSQETRQLANKIRVYLGWGFKQYRKTLVELRAYSNIVEVKMSANDWENINYQSVPSKASLNYHKAFFKHDAAGYGEFIAQVKKGEKKINAATLFPYEIVEQILYKGDNSQTVDVLWNALPNYLEGNNENMLVMADVSGSMRGRPMATSIALAIFTAERNNGVFKNYFITYSKAPQLKCIAGSNIREKISSVTKGIVGMDTNLQAAFDMILNTAIKNNIPKKDMPTKIIVISDMEFNHPQNAGKTNNETVKEKYKNAGYEAPVLVYWNCNSRQNNIASKANEQGVLLVSGSSPSIFKTLLSGKQHTPLDQVLETLNDTIYNRILV